MPDADIPCGDSANATPSASPLHRLFAEQGQSPWLDSVRRDWMQNGELARWVSRGVRGVTTNPSIFQAAIAGSAAYDAEFRSAMSDDPDVRSAYWALVCTDARDALEIFRPVYEDSRGVDGYVSVEVDPRLAHDSAGTEASARELHNRIDAPNLYVKIPATVEGLDPIRQMIAEKRSINVTLIFSLERYDEVIEAYMAGLEEAAGDLSTVSSVASFFVSRIDTEVDRRLEVIGTAEALELRGKAAIANARLAMELHKRRFASERFEALRNRGARPQRLLWASTSPKSPRYPETYYADALIGPDTVNTLPPATLEAFEREGSVARTLDTDPAGARFVFAALAEVGIDVDDVTRRLEVEGVRAFRASFDGLLAALAEKAND